MIARTVTIRAAAPALALVLAAGAAHAAPTKEECVDAHGKGQDARESGQLVRAGKLFLTCAQAACPDLVVRDCSRLAEEVERLTPTLTFAARDGSQRDLPDTAVHVDGVLVAASLGDGRPREIDPGRHEVRFVRGGEEVTITVVVSQGEKGRAVVGTFAPRASSAAPADPPAEPAAPELRRSAAPLVLTGIGAAAMAAGAVLLGVGFAKMPEGCSLSGHTCAAPPADPSFAAASRAVTFMNLGGILGGAGAAALGGSLIWYFAQTPKPVSRSARLSPWLGPQGAGVSFAGLF